MKRGLLKQGLQCGGLLLAIVLAGCEEASEPADRDEPPTRVAPEIVASNW